MKMNEDIIISMEDLRNGIEYAVKGAVSSTESEYFKLLGQRIDSEMRKKILKKIVERTMEKFQIPDEEI
jgi:hypothetical protein